jgi:hypothetical protein
MNSGAMNIGPKPFHHNVGDAAWSISLLEMALTARHQTWKPMITLPKNKKARRMAGLFYWKAALGCVGA